MASVRGLVTGRVQGVGFRYFVLRCAEARSLRGYVRNLHDGRVEFLLQGPESTVAEVIERIREGPPASRVDDLSLSQAVELPLEARFSIR